MFHRFINKYVEGAGLIPASFLFPKKQQRTLSSAGQSVRLITGWPQVQILQGPLANVPTLVSP